MKWNGVRNMAKRRANGEGNIRKRKDGRWEGRYTAGYDENGKRIIKNVLGRTQAEVKAKLKDAVALADVSNVAKADEYTLAQWLRYWMDTYGKVYLRESSQIILTSINLCKKIFPLNARYDTI